MAATKRNIRLALLFVLAVAVGVGVLLYLRAAWQPKELIAWGTLEARTANVGSLVGGRVARVLIDEGSVIVPGQTLVMLETDTIDRQIAQQRATIEAARANLAKAIAGPRPQEIAKAEVLAANDQREAARQDSLYRDGIASKEARDNAATAARASAEDLRLLKAGTRKEDIDAARADVEQEQRRLDSLFKQRAELNVIAPAGGVVQSMGLRPGDLVAPNQPVAEILESNQLWVRVYVPETELGLIHVDQRVRVYVDTFPNQAFAGHIGTVSSVGEYTPRNVQTRAQRAEEMFGVKVLVDPNPKLKAGMAAEVDFLVKGRSR